MKIFSYIRNYCLLLCGLALAACDSVIYDGEGDCSVTYRVKFRYDWNMAFADAFAHEVESVTLYLVDGQGRIAWQKTEAGAALASEDYAMTVDVEPGTYDLLAWCGTTDKGSFLIPEASRKEGLTCTLRREHDATGAAFCADDLDRLYHGYVQQQVFGETEGVYTYTVPLVKNTNNLRVVLQSLSGEALDKDLFEFSVTDDNGAMDWDNSLLDDEDITYYAWHTESGVAEFEDGVADEATSALSAVMADLTVPRMMTGHAGTARLAVRRLDTEEIVLSVPLIQTLLLVKSYYDREMSDQEYLDRQDRFSLVFFLDEDQRWMDAYIYINSWRVVLQGSDL